MKVKLNHWILLLFLIVGQSAFAQKFAVIGDYGWNPNNKQSIHYQADRDKVMIRGQLAIKVVSDMVKSWNPDFIVSLGDDSYWCRLQNNFADNVEPFYGSYVRAGKFFPVLGNHDYKTNIPDIGDCTRGGKNGETLWKEYFSRNSTYYDYVRGDIHFFAMNFNPEEKDGRDVNSKQAQWLKRKLAASTAKFKVVYGHQPVYASCPKGDKHCSNPVLQWPYRKWGADVVLNGDNHYYERNLIDNYTYVVNGVGGAALDVRGSTIPGTTVKHFPSGSSDKRWGAMLFEVKHDNGDYLNIKMYDHNKRIFDQFIVWPNKFQWRACGKE
ncbi:MAG: metallophosphoesterase [Reichenbachiella sp.]|uniref:metallophosphoesterase family protein n=1 Tax=Reichenbachiella sp. TaxID=2184521 RepID=UPI003262E822